MAIDFTRRQLLIATLPLCSAACRNTEPDLSGYTEEEPAHLASGIQMADPRATSQLLTGWYQIEQHSWRWTARQFSAVLRPPPGASRTGALLEFQFNVPSVALSVLKTVTLSAAISGMRFSPETYTHAGDYIYRREIAPDFLQGQSVRVDFVLAKAALPGQLDARELGVIAESLRLKTK